MRVIFHVDMDAFFASIEQRDDPRLRGKPVLVGHAGKRGVVAAASYEARRFGCHSAQPMAVARRRCPQAIIVPGRHEVYLEVSAELFEILEGFTPVVEGLSIDEAFLDMSGTQRLHGPPRVAAERIRQAVAERLRLTCSVGIASAKFIAKIASDQDKPDGLTVVEPGRERAFLHRLPVRELWGVGPRTQQVLERYGVRTIGDIAELGLETLERDLGEHGRHLHQLSVGVDPRPVSPGRERKQVSHENTFGEDLRSRPEIEDWLLRQSTRVADRLVAKGLHGRKVHLKLRDTSFTTWTRQCSLDEPTQEARVIFAHARALLDRLEAEGKLRALRIRLTGVGVSDFRRDAPARQLELLPVEGAAEPTTDDRGEAVQDVLSEVRRRFGGKALGLAGVGGIRREARDDAGAVPDLSTRIDDD